MSRCRAYPKPRSRGRRRCFGCTGSAETLLGQVARQQQCQPSSVPGSRVRQARRRRERSCGGAAARGCRGRGQWMTGCRSTAPRVRAGGPDCAPARVLSRGAGAVRCVAEPPCFHHHHIRDQLLPMQRRPHCGRPCSPAPAALHLRRIVKILPTRRACGTSRPPHLHARARAQMAATSPKRRAAWTARAAASPAATAASTACATRMSSTRCSGTTARSASAWCAMRTRATRRTGRSARAAWRASASARTASTRCRAARRRAARRASAPVCRAPAGLMAGAGGRRRPRCWAAPCMRARRLRPAGPLHGVEPARAARAQGHHKHWCRKCGTN
jgi:hypothetical protein